METGLVIGERYVLQRLIKQGQCCEVYQGIDQFFQRMVAVKSVPTAQVSMYRAAVRMTSQFSAPNVVMLYDLVTKADGLYLIQEYIEGDDFAMLLQTPLQLSEVAEIGRQICSALIYASSSSRRVCHGDLTPTAIFRDRRGMIRVNNFALPSNLPYFTAWSMLGGEGMPLADRELPCGMLSDGRQADDTRAVGLLLYQLLTSRAPGATAVEPPPDGRLRFPRNVPPELCAVVARTVIRHHPQHINRAEVLADELQILVETFAMSMLVSNPALEQTEVVKPRQVSPTAVGPPVNPPPSGQPALRLSPYQDNPGKMAAMEGELPSVSPTVADFSLGPVAVQQAVHPNATEATPTQPTQRSSLLGLLLLGLIIFTLLFIVGLFLGNFLIHH